MSISVLLQNKNVAAVSYILTKILITFTNFSTVTS